MDQELNFIPEALSGMISVKFANDQSLEDFCTANILDYNRDRFEAVAIRIFLGDETIITVYAVDKMRQENSTINPAKIPVKKFKISTMNINELFSYISGFNCTLSTGNYSLEDIEVINK